MSTRASASGPGSLAVQVNLLSVFGKSAFKGELRWKLRPVPWDEFESSATTSVEPTQLFFTKKLDVSDAQRLVPYSLDGEDSRRRVKQEVRVCTMYKPKSKKVLPVDQGDGKGEKPGGREDWYERAKLRGTPQRQFGKYKDHLIPRFSDIPRGSRLTPERLAKLDVGDEITPEERIFFEEMLLNREKAIAFDWKECGRVHEDVSPPIVIKTVPHRAWQSPGIACPKALREQMMEMLRDRLERGVLERCFGPYRNPWFLVSKKAPRQY